MKGVRFCGVGEVKIKAIAYDVLLVTTIIIRCRLRKNCQLTDSFCLFVGAQIAAGLHQTTQIISGVSFTTAHVAYASTNKTKRV